MFVTEHLTGRIQCVDGDFVCINLHYNGKLAAEKFFIDQIYINQKSGISIFPDFNFTLPNGCHFDHISLNSEMQSIVDCYYETCLALGLNQS